MSTYLCILLLSSSSLFFSGVGMERADEEPYIFDQEQQIYVRNPTYREPNPESPETNQTRHKKRKVVQKEPASSKEEISLVTCPWENNCGSLTKKEINTVVNHFTGHHMRTYLEPSGLFYHLAACPSRKCSFLKGKITSCYENAVKERDKRRCIGRHLLHCTKPLDPSHAYYKVILTLREHYKTGLDALKLQYPGTRRKSRR